MNRLLTTLAVVATLLASSCGYIGGNRADSADAADYADELPMPVEVPATAGMARQLVEENTYIDIDLRDVSDRVARAALDSTLIDRALSDDLARARAASYRVYSHVSSTGDSLAYDGTPAAALNISEAMLGEFLKDIADNNATFRKWREDSLDFEVPAVDSAYLQSLLR